MADQPADDRGKTIARAMLDVIVARYPGRLTPAQLELVHQAIGELTEISGRLRAYPLTNADEPDPIFRAYRQEA